MWGWQASLSAIAMVLLVSAAPAGGAPNVKYFTLSDVADEAHFLHQAVARFSEEATNLTMGKIHFNLVPREADGGEEDLIKQVQEGKLDGAIVSVEALAGIAPEFRMLTLPYVFPDEEQAYRVLNGPIGSDLLRGLQQKGVKGLAFVGMGWRHLVLRDRRIEAPGELAGLRIGVTARADGELVDALGAAAEPIAPAGLAGALGFQQIDAISISLETLYSEGFQGSGRYVALTRHAFVPGVIIMNPDKYGYLQQSERESLLRAALDAQRYVRELCLRQAEEIKGHLQGDGVEVYEVDRVAFEEATAPLYDKWSEEFGKKILEKVRNPE